MNSETDIVIRLRRFGDSHGLDVEAADEIERLRSINRAVIDAYESLKERFRSYDNQRIGVLQRSIHELETKIDWYKAVNQQLHQDLQQTNQPKDTLETIILQLKKEAAEKREQ